MAQVVHFRNPFDPLDVESWAARDGTLWELAPRTDLPHLCVVNGDCILRKDWHSRPRAGDHVAFVVLPQGGGGGSKNPFRTLALIALAIVAPQIAAGLGFSGAAASFVAFGINAIGAMLLAPKAPSGLGTNELAAPSPTYTLGAQQNSARIGQPIPVVYGRMRTFPDLAVPPYSEYDNEVFTQTLYLLLTVTQGECDISQIKIEDTPIENYPEVVYNIVPPGGSLSIVNPYVPVVEAGGQELLGTVDGEIQWVGPYVVNSAQTQIDEIAFDLAQPRGNYELTDSGSEGYEVGWDSQVQQLDDEGNPIGGWLSFIPGFIGGRVNGVRRLTFKGTVVTPGRYQFRIGRSTVKPDDPKVVSDLVLGGIRGRLVGTTLYPNCTYIEMSLRATDSLNDQSARRINCLVERKLPIYESGGWSSPVVTRGIVPAFIDILRNDIYGGRIPESRLILDELLELDQTFNDRYEFFDGVFDTLTTQWEAAQIVARAGFAVAIPVGGAITMVRDAPQAVPSALFSPRNMTPNSFQVAYEFPNDESAQAYRFEYLDNRTWRERQVTTVVPGVDDSDIESLRISSAKLFGVTDASHAQRHADYLAAVQTYRRRVASLGTEMDGLLLRYGQVVLLSHDSMQWGEWGDVAAVDGLAYTLTEPVTFENSGYSYIKFTNTKGQVLGPYRCIPGSSPYEVVLVDTPDEDAYVGYDMERSRFVFGSSSEVRVEAKIKAIKPSDDKHCELELALDDDRVYDALNQFVPTGLERVAYYTEDSQVPYDSAAISTLDSLGFYTNDFGRVGENNDPGYIYAPE